jgi:hypothetical protein
MEPNVDDEEAYRVVARVDVLRHRADLDLLVFFARHPRALLTSEQLAAYLGYDLPQIADSLDTLLNAQLLTRTQNRNHAARLYVFAHEGRTDGWLPGLLKLASTREGRLALRAAIPERASMGASDSEGSPQGRTATHHARPFIVRRAADGTSESKAG